MIIAVMAAVLAGGGTYLVLRRGMLRTIIGMTLISHAASPIILSTGVGAWRGEPLLGNEATVGADVVKQMADPLPQAFVLTAIVITVAVAAFILALAGLSRDDDTCIHKGREAMRQLSTTDRRAGKNVPADSDSTVAGTPGISSAPDKFPHETPLGDDGKWQKPLQ